MKTCRLIIISWLFLCAGCGSPDSIEVALNHADDNRLELEKEPKVHSTAIREMREEVIRRMKER